MRERMDCFENRLIKTLRANWNPCRRFCHRKQASFWRVENLCQLDQSQYSNSRSANGTCQSANIEPFGSAFVSCPKIFWKVGDIFSEDVEAPRPAFLFAGPSWDAVSAESQFEQAGVSTLQRSVHVEKTSNAIILVTGICVNGSLLASSNPTSDLY